MKLLGKYNSNLVPFYAEELLKLLEQAITLGEYGGSRLVDAAAVEKLKQQSRDSLPAIDSGRKPCDVRYICVRLLYRNLYLLRLQNSLPSVH